MPFAWIVLIVFLIPSRDESRFRSASLLIISYIERKASRTMAIVRCSEMIISRLSHYYLLFIPKLIEVPEKLIYLHPRCPEYCHEIFEVRLV